MRHNAFAVRQRGARGPAYNDAVTQASVYAGEQIDDVKGLNVLMLPAGTTAVLDGDGASMGFTIAAGQSGGTAQLIGYPLKDSRTIKDLEGKTIRILARYWASTNFLFLKPLEPNYVDIGRFQGNLGGALVSQSQVGNILTRIVEYTVAGTEDYLGIIAQVVAGAASTGAPVTLKLVGLSYTVVGESAVTVDKAIGAKAAERFGLSLAGDFQNGIGQKGSGPIDGTVTILRDATTGYANGLRVLAGNTGAGNTMSVFTLVAPEDFALVRGARARVTVVLKTSAVFNRKLDILVGGHVRATGGGPLNEYRAMAQHVYPGRLVAVVEGIFDAGTEQITVTANNISTTNAAADQDWQFEDVRVEIVATAEGSLTGAQATMALQRNFWARRRQRPVGQQVSVAISGGDFTNFYTTFANVVAYQDINLAADGGAYVFTTSTEETRPLFPPFANAIVRGVGATRPAIRLRQPSGASLSDVENNSASDFHHSGEFYNLDIGAGGARYAIHSDDGANHYYNQKMVFRRITATHEGNDAIAGGWRNCAALGFGLTTGSSKDFIACTFRGYDFSAVIGHGDANATAPGAARFIDTSMTPQAKVGTTSLNLDGFYYAVASSGHCDDIEITGSNPNGPVTIGSAFWAQTDPAKIPAFKMNINVHGHANAEFPYVLQDDGSRALRITSASTGASSAVAISGTAADKLFATSAKRTTQAGAAGVSAFVTGWFDVGNHNVGPASDQDVVRISKRLAAGDVLTVAIDGGTAVNVTFTSGMTSDQFMTALTAALGATASAVLFNVNDLYRPEFPTEEHRVCNATSATIPRKTALCWTSAGRPFVRVMTPSDPVTSFAGICYGNDILPGLYGRAKASGQVRVTMDLLRSDAAAIKAGDILTVSTNDGKVAVGSGPGIFVAINDKDVRVGAGPSLERYTDSQLERDAPQHMTEYLVTSADPTKEILRINQAGQVTAWRDIATDIYYGLKSGEFESYLDGEAAFYVGEYLVTSADPNAIITSFNAAGQVTGWIDRTTGVGYGTSAGGEVTIAARMYAVVSAGRIDINIHQFGDRYVQWQMTHDIVSERNANVWRISRVREVKRNTDGSFSQIQEICFDGETEVAIKFIGKPDHIGGQVHGNEEQTMFRLMFDGVEVDPADVGTFACQRIDMMQASDMFELGNTSGTVWLPKGAKIMTCYKHWQWTPANALQLSQRIAFEATCPAFQVENDYFGMACLGWGTRGYDAVDYAARSPLWLTEDVSGSFSQSYTSADTVMAWGDRYAAEVRMTKGWNSSFRNVAVDNRTDRRKIYPDFHGGSGSGVAGETVTPGGFWDVQTCINITIKE